MYHIFKSLRLQQSCKKADKISSCWRTQTQHTHIQTQSDKFLTPFPPATVSDYLNRFLSLLHFFSFSSILSLIPKAILANMISCCVSESWIRRLIWIWFCCVLVGVQTASSLSLKQEEVKHWWRFVFQVPVKYEQLMPSHGVLFTVFLRRDRLNTPLLSYFTTS